MAIICSGPEIGLLFEDGEKEEEERIMHPNGTPPLCAVNILIMMTTEHKLSTTTLIL